MSVFIKIICVKCWYHSWNRRSHHSSFYSVRFFWMFIHILLSISRRDIWIRNVWYPYVDMYIFFVYKYDVIILFIQYKYFNSTWQYTNRSNFNYAQTDCCINMYYFKMNDVKKYTVDKGQTLYCVFLLYVFSRKASLNTSLI